ncbi:MAG: formylglycine-generating enzyme family protein [Verrucomicrobia bacterium]|nr:formylglycine-generating enzyme family protein [Verrucomicrobiota bacterium]
MNLKTQIKRSVLTCICLWTVYSASPGASAAEKPEITNPKMVWIPPGSFKLGSPTNEIGWIALERQWTVTFRRGFFMAKHEVTQGEFLVLMEYNPSYFSARKGFPEDLNSPVETVTWTEASAYCAELNEVEEAAARLPSGWEYRLPTDGEWEYACRAGTTTPFHYGPDLRSGMANFNSQRGEYVQWKGNVANAGGANLGKTTAVESYQPNAWGLYDMHGNVWEMCSTVGSEFTRIAFIDPPFLSPWTRTDLAGHLRGGAFSHDGGRCRSSYPGIFFANQPGVNYIGFRPVLAPVQTATPLSFVPPALSEGQLIINWIGPGTLQSADAITGPWTDVVRSWVNPLQTRAVPIREAAKFYRLRE